MKKKLNDIVLENLDDDRRVCSSIIFQKNNNRKEDIEEFSSNKELFHEHYLPIFQEQINDFFDYSLLEEKLGQDTSVYL